jgi:hypothetical protein
MTFADLLAVLVPYPKIEALVLDLWQQKLTMDEHKSMAVIPELNDFIQHQMNNCRSFAEALEENAVRTDMLDAFFRMVIQTYNGDY